MFELLLYVMKMECSTPYNLPLRYMKGGHHFTKYKQQFLGMRGLQSLENDSRRSFFQHIFLKHLANFIQNSVTVLVMHSALYAS